MDPYVPPMSGREKFLRLDFNENTTGCSRRVLSAIRKSLDCGRLAAYPEYEESRAKIAAAFGRSPEETILTNGIDDAILLLLSAFVEPGQRVVTAEPCFSMYRFYVSVVDARPVSVRRAADMQFPLKGVRAAAAKGARAILVDNPNNPTGTAIEPRRLIDLARDFPSTLILVDEAYFDFYGQTALPAIARHRNLLVARTFSKAHGLAALRMGCLFAHRETAAILRKAHSPFSVNSVALVAAVAALGDRRGIESYARGVVAARAFFEASLSKMSIPFFPSRSNFVLADFGRRLPSVKGSLRRNGILISDRSAELPGCARITIGTLPQMRRVVRALRSILREPA